MEDRGGKPAGAAMPMECTCMGSNVNPPLTIYDVPADAKSLVLIFEDRDALPKAWTHWMLFDIPAVTGLIRQNEIPSGAVEGLANNHSFGYEGPCPKYFLGTHHYIFRLFALDCRLELPAATERETVEEKMKGHILCIAELPLICISKKKESVIE